VSSRTYILWTIRMKCFVMCLVWLKMRDDCMINEVSFWEHLMNMFCLKRLHCSDELFIKNIWEEALKIKGNSELSGETQHITPQTYWHITKPSAPIIYPIQSCLVTSHTAMECGWWWRCFSLFIVMMEHYVSLCMVKHSFSRFRIVVFANRNKSAYPKM